MRKCLFRINPATLLDLVSDGRYLLTVQGGVPSRRAKCVKKVAVDPQDGTIGVWYEQEEVVHLPGEMLEHVNPQISLVEVPSDIDKLASQIQGIADLCIEKLGAPSGVDFDIVEFLRDNIAPFFAKQKERVN